MTANTNNTGALPWRKHLLLVVIVVAYIVLAVAYSIATPIFEASDELWHYPMVKYIADHGFTLPVQSPADPGPMRQEGSQPPLYYMLGAALTAGINTADMDAVRVLNPHPDLGVLRPDGNINTVVHSPQAEGFPWRGTVLAVHIVRLFSVLLGAVTVLLTYRLSLELLPANRTVALGAAAFAAFNPMFLFISGAINNDNLSTTLASLLLVQLAYLAAQTEKPSVRQLAAIGVVAGCGMLAKFNIGFLLPFVAVALGIAAHRHRDWRVFVAGAAISGGLTVLIAGWWYVRNWSLYGDPTGLNIFLQTVGQREIPANAAQLWSERHTFLMSYWGFFGGVNVPLPDQVYTVFNAIAAVSAVSLAGAALRKLSSAIRRRSTVRLSGLGWARLFAALWVVVLFVSLLRWTQATWASQGRLMFAALAPISIGMSLGLWWLGGALRLAQARLVSGAIAWFVLVAALAPILIVRSYSDPSFLVGLPEGGTVATVPIAEFQDDGPNPQVLRVSECCALPTSVYPGQYLTFDVAVSTPAWEPSATSWSLFVHLVDKDGLIVAQRDVLLRQGLWATTRMNINPPGLQWLNRIAVLLPDHAYTPSTLNLVLGFADSDQPSHRMRAIAAPSDTPRSTTKDTVTIGSVRLLPRVGGADVPNPTSVNFGDAIDFLGYEVSSLKLDPAQSVEVTLYWRARRPLTTDYTAFVHIFNPATTEIFGGSDGMARPTSTWPVGTTIVDKHSFAIKADAPPGTWQIEIGLYDYAGGQFNRLRVVTIDGGQANNFLLLSRVLIGVKP